MWRIRDVGVLSLNGISITYPEGSGTYVEEEEILKEPEVVDDYKRTVSPDTKWKIHI